MYHRILVAYDGSAGADKALHSAISTAKEHGAELHLVAVEEGLPRYAATADEIDAVKEQKDAYYQKLCARAEAEAAAAGIPITPHVLPGHPSTVIPDLGRELGCDLIVTGFHGHGNLHARIFGSTCREIILCSECPVLVVK
ncbi:MAG: universal stress protein [Armatimonadetes bacterium]|nr:universal stress protein [Armatimonadota bacterium]